MMTCILLHSISQLHNYYGHIHVYYTTSTISLLYFIMPTPSCTYVPSNVYVDTYMLECGCGGGKLLELLKALKMYFVSDIISLPTFSYRRMLPREICPVSTKYKQTTT